MRDLDEESCSTVSLVACCCEMGRVGVQTVVVASHSLVEVCQLVRRELLLLGISYRRALRQLGQPRCLS
jgi:hypothetical protein